MASVYFLTNNKKLIAISLLLFAIGVKLTAIFMVPAFLFYFFRKSKDNKAFFTVTAFFMILGTIVVSLASGQNKNPEIRNRSP